jgi:hypothetical protein
LKIIHLDPGCVNLQLDSSVTLCLQASLQVRFF